MAKEVRSSFGTNGLKKASRNGGHQNSANGSGSSHYHPHLNNSRSLIPSPNTSSKHQNQGLKTSCLFNIGI